MSCEETKPSSFESDPYTPWYKQASLPCPVRGAFSAVPIPIPSAPAPAAQPRFHPANLQVPMPQSYPIDVQGMTIQFPVEKPYPAQQIVLAGAITGLRTPSHGLLESPTGTGKTIALVRQCVVIWKMNRTLVVFITGRARIHSWHR
jgi:hypothetical protein